MNGNGATVTIPDHIPIVAVCGRSGAGKTTVIEQVAAALVQRQLKVGIVRLDVHGPEAGNIRHILGRDEDRVAAVLRMVDARLAEAWRLTPLFAGVLIGGRNARMGRPKHLMTIGRTTFLEHTVHTVRAHVDEILLLGAADVPASLSGLPRLTDVHGARGPLAGMRAAMRWAPQCSWLFVACDLPLISHDALDWLLGTRAPGVWAALPKLSAATDYVEPLLAHYDFRARPLLEDAARPADIAALPHVITPVVPTELARAWTNVNSANDMARILQPDRAATGAGSASQLQ